MERPSRLLVLVAFAGLACGGGAGPEEEWNFRDSDGPPRGGGWYINNGVFHPDVAMFDPGQALTSAGGIDEDRLDTPNRVKSAQYAVECALTEEQSLTVSIDGEPTTFDGALGLAPQWLSGPCNGDCQEWVSACLLARTNLTGIADVEVVLWIDDPSSSDDPDPDYTYEAGFFGNLFTSSSGYLCQDPAGLLSSVTAARVCSVT
ncbi:MAG: hypothetical protein KDK70_13435, partial [Myxococcales bacterium]|nr:hypothetical protein [Myxococcales bacterium]